MSAARTGRAACTHDCPDAQRRGIRDGAAVRVWNERGTVVAHARVTDRVREGTVAMPFGHWIRDGANALTSDRFGDLGHGPTFCAALVEVAPAFHTRTAAGS